MTDPVRARRTARRTVLESIAAVVRLVPLRGRGRLAYLLHRSISRRTSAVVAVQTRTGARLELPLASAQTWQVVMTGRYDDESVTMLCRHIAPGSLVIDVGASLGLYTVALGIAARAAGAEVLAVEPLERNCDFIKGNVARNGLVGVARIVRSAVGAAEGSLILHSESGGAGNATVVSGLDAMELSRHDAVGGLSHEECVPVCRLDDLVGTIGQRVSLIKIDVEGFEFEVLAGAERTIADHRPVVAAELSPEWLRSRGVPLAALQTWLSDHEYRCLEIWPVHIDRWSDRRRIELREISGAEQRSGQDLLLVPREHALADGG